MPPRLPPSIRLSRLPSQSLRLYATVSTPPLPPTAAPTQPPSFRAADLRKTQLHRQYLSLLRSTPLMLIFQYNNLRAVEWAAIRRELHLALSKLSIEGAEDIKIIVLRTTVFGAVVRVSEFYKGDQAGTSINAYSGSRRYVKHALGPLFTGPVGVVTFPSVEPEQLKAVVDLMFPEGRLAKGLDPLATSGLQKLILLAARVDGHVAVGKQKVVDRGGIRWVAGLPGFEALRGQLVAILQSVGGGEIVRALESVGTGVVRTIDGHRKVLAGELEGNPAEENP